MSDRYPGLGFHPAPGEPEEVRRCARAHARVADELDQLADAVAGAGETSTAWKGAAATAFRSALTPLPAQLRRAAEAFGATAARLSAWAGELEDLQAEARALERTASAALDRMRAAHARAASAPGAVASSGPIGSSAVLGGSALLGGGLHVVDVADAEHELRRATWAADDVKSRWRAGGRRTAATVQAAAEAAPPVPETFGELVWQHRRTISGLADVSSVVSLPVSAVPVVGPPAAAALGIASTAGQAALAAYADGSLTDVALGGAGVGLGGAAMVVSHAVRSPVAGAATRATARGLQVGDVGYTSIGGAMTVHKHSAGPAAPPARSSAAPPARAPGAPPSATAPPPTAQARPSPALRQLLVDPVTDEPSRKRP